VKSRVSRSSPGSVQWGSSGVIQGAVLAWLVDSSLDLSFMRRGSIGSKSSSEAKANRRCVAVVGTTSKQLRILETHHTQITESIPSTRQGGKWKTDWSCEGITGIRALSDYRDSGSVVSELPPPLFYPTKPRCGVGHSPHGCRSFRPAV